MKPFKPNRQKKNEIEMKEKNDILKSELEKLNQH